MHFIYTLCMDQPIDGQRHYIGRCRAARLHVRMLEHKHGGGGILTKKSQGLAKSWFLSHLWLVQDPRLEQFLIALPDTQRPCWRCARILPGRLVEPAQKKPPGEPWGLEF